MSASWLYRLLEPSAPEPLPLTHLRRAARGQVFSMPVLAAINLVYFFLRRREPGPIPDLGNAALVANLSALALWEATNVWLLIGERTERTFLRGAVVSTACLLLSTMVATWATGTPTNAPAAVLAIIAALRIYYNQRIGVATLLLAIAIHLGLLALVIGGYLPPHLEKMAWGAQPSSTTWFVWCGVRIVIFYTLAWVVASMIANAFRKSEHALRVAQDARERMRSHVEGLQRLGRDSVASATAADPQIGRLSGSVLGGIYELHELLGRGGMGEVYQAVRLVDGQEVAIKVLHAALGGEPRMLERFRREAELAARLPGRHVPAVLEHGISQDGHHYIAMELLKGEDLAAFLKRRGTLPANELLPIVDGLAQALDAAHDCGIVHRDLKPQNIFLADTERGSPAVKLLDFGIARLYESQATHGTLVAVLGTPGFLAPEQARGELGRIGPATDVFALGAVIYRALTGRHAFPSRDLATAVFESVFHHPAPPSEQVRGLATDVDLVLAIALAKTPGDRYQRASELASDLRVALLGRLPQATRDRVNAIMTTRQRRTLVESDTAPASQDTGVTEQLA